MYKRVGNRRRGTQEKGTQIQIPLMPEVAMSVAKEQIIFEMFHYRAARGVTTSAVM